MTDFTLRFLGNYEVLVKREPLRRFSSDKERALLAYLALEPHDHPRIKLATLLWPKIGDQYALKNLRNTLHRLRQTLNAAADGAADQALTVTRRTVQFNAEQAQVDVVQFQTLLDVVNESPATRVERLAQAVKVYKGELLAGFGVADASPFEEWLLLRREILQQRALLAFYTLAAEYETQGQYKQAYDVTSRLLALDPYHEEIVRLAMRLLARMRQPDQALKLLEQLRQRLHNDLNVEPSDETLALAGQITAHEFAQLGERRRDPTDVGKLTAVNLPKHPPFPAPADLAEIPDPGPFFGRVRERQQVLEWILHERCRLVAILGIGGVGKTSLAAQCVRALINGAGHVGFDVVFWRSLLNAPLLTELLPPLLQSLSDHQLPAAPESLDEQLRLLTGYLRAKRVLLVLDNAESILEAESAGSYRPGYEAYGQLIQQMATVDHQSCLLLTSRERPRNYALLERDGHTIQSLYLRGLDHDAGRELLVQRGVRNEGSDATLLVERYSGNPLALKLVADTVDDLFGGDLSTFLANDTLIFDDIRTVLDQHFARLTEVEQQILFWLAAEREPALPQDLHQKLLQPPTQRIFLEALRNLQRRSLIERQAVGFGLQNVVIEYLTERLVAEVCQEIVTGDLNRLHQQALLQAQAEEYVRQSQARLILQPLAEQLLAGMGLAELKTNLKQQLESLRRETSNKKSYAGGNIFNLLTQLKVDFTEFDFSHLSLWQAHLQGVLLSNVNFAWADLTGSTFTQMFGQVCSTAISPDGQLLSSGAESGDITIWRLRDYQPLMSLSGHTNSVSELAFSPDGSRLASSSNDSTIRLWDMEFGQSIWVAKSDQQLVFSVAYSPDGRLLVSGGNDPFVYVWDSDSGELICRLEAHPDGVTREVAFHPSRPLFAAANLSGDIFFWDVTSLHRIKIATVSKETEIARQVIPAINQESYISVTFSHDGVLVAGGDNHGVIRIWQATTRAQVQMLTGHQASVRSLKFSPDDETLASSSFDQTVRLWDVKSGRCKAIFPHNGVVWSVTFSPSGKTLVSSGEDSIIRVWTVAAQRRVELVKMLHGYRCFIPAAAFNSSAPMLALGDSLGSIRLWQIDQAKFSLIDTLLEHDRVDALAFSPNGQFLASAGGIHDHAIRLWDVNSRQCLAVLAGHVQRVRSLAFSPDGVMLASAGEDATLRLWDVRNPRACRLHYVLHEHQYMIYNLSFNRDGAKIATSSQDSTVRIWETTTGRQINCITGLGGNEIIAFSPTADILACSAGTGGGIRLLDLSMPHAEKQLNTLTGHIHEPVSISFSPDGKQLVSSSSDHSVCVWDVEVGKQRYVRDVHKAYVHFVAFQPTGRYFLSSSIDGMAYLWDAKTGECVHTFLAPRPYDGMNITGITGISAAQRASLKALGAVENA